MNKNVIRTAVTAAAFFGFTAAAFAVTGEFGDMCTTGLAMHKQIKTDCSVNAPYNKKTYCFGDQKAEVLQGSGQHALEGRSLLQRDQEVGRTIVRTSRHAGASPFVGRLSSLLVCPAFPNAGQRRRRAACHARKPAPATNSRTIAPVSTGPGRP